MSLPKVRLFLLGGTITMDKAPGTASGVVPSVDAAALCRAVPGLDQIADLQARTDHMVASANLTYQHAFALAAEITQADQKGEADGFVIVQGTDTLEEMAFLLDCLLDIKRPVAVTGAMRSPAQLSADGPANIMAAVICATTQAVGAAGVSVVMNDDIHAARFVTKAHTGNVAAFQSPAAGPIGRVTEGTAHIFTLPVPTVKILVPETSSLPEIALITASFGDTGIMLDLLEKSSCAGLVIEALGAGHLPEKYLDMLDCLTRKMPVILSSRVGNGHIFQNSYGYQGAEIDLIKRGLIPAGILDGPKAKILLTLLVMAGRNPAEIREIFYRWNF